MPTAILELGDLAVDSKVLVLMELIFIFYLIFYK